jgi:anti-sigma factor RsiW
MSGEKAPVRESDLIAYADGRLDGQRAAEVEAHLAQDKAAAETVAAWRQQNETIRELYDHVAREKVPSWLDVHRLAQRGPVPATRSWRLAAAAAIFLAVGIAGGWFARGTLVPGENSTQLIGEALAAHRLYSSEVVHPVEVAAKQEAHLAKWLSKRLDRPLEIPDLRQAGFNLVGGRLLPAGDRPAAQFMYEDGSGRRVTLYIVPTPERGETAFHYAAAEKLGTYYWRDARITCALVGDLPRDLLHRLALDAYHQLD